MPSRDRQKKAAKRNYDQQRRNDVDSENESECGSEYSNQPSTSRKRLRNDGGEILLHSSVSPGRRTVRQIELDNSKIELIATRMRCIVQETEALDYPTAKIRSNLKQKERLVRSCGGSSGCSCSSYIQCYQNAKAYLEASEYVHTYPETFVLRNVPKLGTKPSARCHARKILHEFKCGSKLANHQVDYYATGRFGEQNCQYCQALLLRGEAARCNGGIQTPCCANGKIHSETMQHEFDELQNPPKDYLEQLLDSKDERRRSEFLNNTMALNNKFAFASTRVDKAPLEEMGGRADTCKYNGTFSFNFSDLVAPDGRQPQFAQVYTLSPEDAVNLRVDQFTGELGKRVGRDVFTILERIMREENWMAQSFVTGVEMFEQAQQALNGVIPEFQIVLLTHRELQDDAIKNKQGCKVIERTDAPTAKQVAVIWVSDEGNAPDVQVHAMKLRYQTSTRLHTIDNDSPLVEPSCFPLLFPKGTLGWRWDLKKRAYETKHKARRDQGLQQMDEQLLEAHLADVQDFGDNISEPVDDDQFIDDIEQALDADINEDTYEDTISNIGVSSDLQSTSAFQDTDDSGLSHRNADLCDDEPFMQTNMGVSVTVREQERITLRQYGKYVFALRSPSKHSFHWLWFARRLAEFYVISLLNRLERQEMEYVRKIQLEHPRRQILASEFVEAIQRHLAREHAGAKLGKIFTMPKTFAGSRQYYNEKYADLMTIVRNLGAPTWFVTFTGNPTWPEIVMALQKGQDYTHRPDIVCRVFMDKAREFIKDLVERHVLGNVIGYCYSVEHQKRGMPHMHILLIMSRKTPIRSPEQVDQYVNARIPPLPAMTDESVEAHQMRRHWLLVKSSMLHDCNPACGGNIGYCNKYFPKKYSEQTVLSDDRYSEYVRLCAFDDGGVHSHYEDLPEDCDPDMDLENRVEHRRLRPPQGRVVDYKKEGLKIFLKKKRSNRVLVLDDRHVIPHNSYLLLKYGCHINIEYVFGQKACKYIFKYLLKGFEKAYVRVCQLSEKDKNVYDYDEITATFKVRYMTAMEAYLRLHSYPIVKLSHQIYKMGVHEEGKHNIAFRTGQEVTGYSLAQRDTRLTAFFKLCNYDDFASKLTYNQVPHYYRWDQKSCVWIRRKFDKHEDPEKAKMFVRIYTVSPKRQELFALRCLLHYKKGPKSFGDLKSGCATFGEAAEKEGLLESDDIYFAAMEDACDQIKNDFSLQRYLALLILHCQPSDPQRLFDSFLDKLYPPPSVPNQGVPLSITYRRAKVLMNIEYFLTLNGSSCANVGLIGLPKDFNVDRHAATLEEEMFYSDFYGSDINQARHTTPQQYVLHQLEKLNTDQKLAFDAIKNALNTPDTVQTQRLFFLEGAGGCGKTFLYNTLIRWCLAGRPEKNSHHKKGLDRRSVLAAASTGIAALMLLGGGTVHRQFCVPNDVDETTESRMQAHTAIGQRVKQTKLIVIDEISMLPVNVLNYVNRVLQDICDNKELFGNKVVVLGGDWKQLAPVVERGGRNEQIRASIKLSPIFKHFKTLRLSQNMRTGKDEKEFAGWLMGVGNGVQNGVKTDDIEISVENQCSSLQEIINFCFPSDLFLNPLANAEKLVDSALMCPRNDDVALINALTINTIRGKMLSCPSIDQPINSDEMSLSIFSADFNLENVHNETPSGLPPHELQLKIGAPVMLIRNLDVSRGLCNGTRMQIKKITTANLTCRVLTGPKANSSEDVLIPLVKFEHGKKKGHRGPRFTRLQFPIRPCFAMTINKSQGQTLQKMGLVLDGKQCFAHGQGYTSVSRVTKKKGIRVFDGHIRTDGGLMKIKNVIYRELLE